MLEHIRPATPLFLPPICHRQAYGGNTNAVPVPMGKRPRALSFVRSVYLVQHGKQQATLTLHQFVCAITALDFLKSFLHTPLPTHLCHWVLYPPHRWIPDTKHHRHREQHTFSQGQRIRWMEKLRHRQTLWRPWIKKGVWRVFLLKKWHSCISPWQYNHVIQRS